eukprot:m.59252 g.59252  ORF g.59252 m.59252 type:complete len:1418 (+) comp7903_c0_seq3:26-4279(+)
MGKREYKVTRDGGNGDTDFQHNGCNDDDDVVNSNIGLCGSVRYKRSPHPRDWNMWNPLNWYKFITFAYCTPIMRIGWKRQLSIDDFFEISKSDEARNLTDMVEKEWIKEKNKPNSSLKWAYVRAIRGQWLLTSFLLLIECVIQIAEPFMLGQIVKQIQDDSPLSDVYISAIILMAIIFVHVFLHHLCFLWTWNMAYRFMAATIGLIYRKSLKISKQSFATLSTGHVVNLVSNDIERFLNFSVMAHFIYLAPIQTILGAYLIWQQVGASTLFGIGVYILFLPLNIFMGKAFASLRRKAAERTDERVKIVSEILSSMRIIKMYGWEKPFRELIAEIRKKEMSAIVKTNVIRGCNMAFFFVSSILTSLLTFLGYELLIGGLTAEKVFTTIAIFQAMRINIAFFFPAGIQSISELRVSFDRFENFLRREEHPHLCDGAAPYGHSTLRVMRGTEDKNVTETDDQYLPTVVTPTSVSSMLNDVDKEGNTLNGHSSDENDEKTDALIRSGQPFVKLENVYAKWTDTVNLKNVSLTCQPGKLIALVGAVGSGKSSLLMTILGELVPTHGTVHQRGTLGYASQEAWVLNDTVQNNIIFGHEFDEEKFDLVTNVCQFTTDLHSMPHGKDTELGERGVTLSGGQKARLSLCRAVYADADVYLLDDPLSAVDAKVGRALFEECIRGILLDKVVILVTHQLQFLQAANELIVLNNGNIKCRGTYQHLMAEDSGLAEILRSLEQRDRLKSESVDDSIVISADSDVNEENRSEHKEVCIDDLLNFSYDTSANIIIKSSVDNNENIENVFESQEQSTQLVQEEGRAKGNVNFNTYRMYLKSAFRTYPIFFLWLLLVILVQACHISANWFLSYWVGLPAVERKESKNLGIYGALVAVFIIGCVLRAVLFMIAAARASRELNHNAFTAVTKASVRFFDTNPVGRILNRFSKDMGFLDDLMPWTLFDIIQLSFLVLGICLLVISVNFWMVLVLIPLIVAFRMIQLFYLRTSREVKRVEAINRSPVYSHFNATLSGLPTLRAHNSTERFKDVLIMHQNEHGRAYTLFVIMSRWLGVRLDALTFVFIAGSVFTSISLKSKLSAGEVGLIISYVLQLTNMFQWFIRQNAEVENQMTSVERIIEYGALTPEHIVVGSPSEEDANHELEEECKKVHWPNHGAIVFDNVCLRYAEGDVNRLKNISVQIPAGAKVGIVGRTGAGKSSLLAALFRLAPTSGSVIIDGVDTKKLSLPVLRQSMGVIPQDPVLFSGDVRKNLDPFHEHTDEELWRAVEHAHLREKIKNLEGGLGAEMSEAGGNFSVGERQLVCLARSMLQSTSILILDEATANVDTETDALIQETIRVEFQTKTVLTIAHRLHTILDSDFIMGLDHGRVVEFGPPEELIDSTEEGCVFSMLAKQARVKRSTIMKAAENRNKRKKNV